jgi:ribosomal-protein-alanine N-acetyltransferase
LEHINTERLSLRKFIIEDIDSMLKNWIADPIIQNAYGEPVFETKESVKNLLLKWDTQPFRWAIILKNNLENIGQAGFCRYYPEEKTAEIEYCIGQNYWGNGYASEAVKAIINYVFKNSTIEKIEAFHQIKNPNSGKVLQKAGMIIVSNIKRFEIQGKTPDEEICYAITKKQFLNNR